MLISRYRKPEDVGLHERERMVGWVDDEGVYLLPTVALERVRKLLGQQSITASLQVLYSQFDGLHLLGSKGKDKITRAMRMQGETQRVLHLVPAALITADETVYSEPEDTGLADAEALGL